MVILSILRNLQYYNIDNSLLGAEYQISSCNPGICTVVVVKVRAVGDVNSGRSDSDMTLERICLFRKPKSAPIIMLRAPHRDPDLPATRGYDDPDISRLHVAVVSIYGHFYLHGTGCGSVIEQWQVYEDFYC